MKAKRIKKLKMEIPEIIKKDPNALVLMDGKNVILHSIESLVINVNMTKYAKTGISVYLPDGYYGILRTISSTFINNSISIHHATKHIFPDQNSEELLIALTNDGNENFLLDKKTPIAVLYIIEGYQAKPRLKEVSI